jgi:hypothetical protein
MLPGATAPPVRNDALVTEPDRSWHIRRAQRMLSDMGAPIAGQEVTQFVVRLLDGVDHGMADEDVIDGAAFEVADGPPGLLHGEPAIQHVPLDRPVRTAGEAAEVAMRVFARRIIERHRRDPFVPPPTPTPEQRDALRAAWEASLPARLAQAREHLSSPEWHERADAAVLLGSYRDGEARAELEGLRADPYPQVREAAETALRRLTGA